MIRTAVVSADEKPSLEVTLAAANALPGIPAAQWTGPLFSGMLVCVENAIDVLEHGRFVVPEEDLAIIADLEAKLREIRDAVERRWKGLARRTLLWLRQRLRPGETLTPAEVQHLELIVLDLIDSFPVPSSEELVLQEFAGRLAVELVRPRKRGAKPKWPGLRGAFLVHHVNLILEERGWERAERKQLLVAIDVLRRSMPSSYGKFSEGTLRGVYYAALPTWETMLNSRPDVQSANSAE